MCVETNLSRRATLLGLVGMLLLVKSVVGFRETEYFAFGHTFVGGWLQAVNSGGGANRWQRTPTASGEFLLLRRVRGKWRAAA